MASEEQKKIGKHPFDAHGRILAGPGTGKSTTVLKLAARLREERKHVRVITFTRAATAELVQKIREENHTLVEPTTVHGFALSVLMHNPGATSLPEPLRVPDEWESDTLIKADLARRLRTEGFKKVTVKTIQKLETEMASAWESLNTNERLLADIDPKLRNRYLSLWQAHRGVFGYSLFAEMPLYAKDLIEDRDDAKLGKMNFLVVDEFQDLNLCEIGLLSALAKRNIQILAVGDDDQSIYSFRMAHPVGIQEFPQNFGARDYSLSISFRCGKAILEVATALIETAPGRPDRPALRPSDGNPPGVFKYLRFATESAEQVGVADLVAHLVREGLKPSDIVILMRSDSNSQWSKPVRAALEKRRIAVTDVETALEPLAHKDARRLLAIARLAVSRVDDLAWWTLLHATNGVAEEFLTAVTDHCIKKKLRFGSTVADLDGVPRKGLSTTSLNKAQATVAQTLALLDSLEIDKVPESPDGWATWLLETAKALKIPVAAELEALVRNVGKVTAQSKGLNHFLNQLEPITKDQALKTDAVSIMSMGRSKGLTFRAAIVMGVEDGVIPFPRADDPEEERRLLYVAMTRAREYLYLTMAQHRSGPTARSGGELLHQRQRCKFLQVIRVSPEDAEDYIASLED